MASSSFTFALCPTPDKPSTGIGGPYLIPPSTSTPVDYTKPLAIWIGAVTTSATTASTPGIAASDAQPAFSLSFAPGTYSGAPIFAKIEAGAEYVYATDTGKRSAMAAAYAAFAQQVEALEATSPTNGGLLPATAAIVMMRTAQALPLRIDEILPYLYGFDAGNQYVDLPAGSSLRIEWSGYQYCDPPEGPGYAFNAFANSGVGRYRIVRRPDNTLVFDALLGALVPGYAANPPASQPVTAAGLFDLGLSGQGRRHLRLVLPATIVGAGAISDAGPDANLGVRLLGADTYADIAAATADVLAGGNGCGKQAPGHNPIVSIGFNSRVLAIPEISVTINDIPTQVPLGTSVRNLVVERTDPAPGWVGQRNEISGANDIGIKLFRWFQYTGQPIATNGNQYATGAIQFTPQTTSQPVPVGPLGDAFDMPLIKGDMLKIKTGG